MAEIHIHYDTKKKTAKATVDGKKVANLHEVLIHRTKADMGDGGADSEDGAYACQMSQAHHDPEHKTHHMSRLYACEMSEAGGAVESKEFPGLFESKVEEKTQAQLDIESFFKK